MAKKKQSNSASVSESNNSTDRGNNNGVEKVRRTRKTVPRDSPSKRSSIYRGVTRHRWTGRFEAHLWDKNCWNESQNKKGRQVYLGAYDDEEAAARAYDLAALKYWGQETILNFSLLNYQEELKEMAGLTKEEYIGSLRRKSSGFSRGVSKYRGVARHHHNGRWEARIGRVFGNKYLYLGTYATQEEAATAYDMAAIEYRGLNAVTNFDLSRYIKWLRPNPESSIPTLDPTHPSNSGDRHSFHHSHPPPPPSHHPHHQQNHSGTPPPSSSSSALGLLLRSPSFKEMMERSSPADTPSSPPDSDGKPSSPPDSDGKLSSRCSFPEDIQTYFGCNDGVSFAEGDDTIFAELNAFEAPIFQCALDV
ncbi:AP2-like ethylene-responsive transcription factor [Platanthera guangdongensis]|uniref:AP2-like ethylene-responsive transcription factor n=1 Tax=Platanthera guangdongensis TaxID=2320717 RepID=A0ABR2LWT7_9ASPA